MEKTKKVTIKDVAKHTGYSIATVSRVLNKKGIYYSDKTYAKIQAAIKKLNFSPNAIARGLKTQKTFNIAFLEPWVAEFFSEVFLGAQDAANEAGYSAAIFSSNNDPEQEKRNIESIIANRMGGIIVCSAILKSSNLLRITSQDIPLVIIEKFAKNKDITNVSVKNREVSREAINYLISLGHKRIGFLSMPLNIGKHISRFRGYKDALKENNIKFDQSLVFLTDEHKNEAFKSSYDFIMANIDMIKRCTALFTTSDITALAIIRAVTDSNMNVPADLSIIGYDGLELSNFTSPTLTPIVQPKYEMGNSAVQMLIKKINGEKIKNIIIEAKFSIGESTGKPG